LSATVPTAGTYYFEVVTYYDTNQSSSAFQQFTIGSSTPAPTYTLTYTAGTGGTISGTSPQTVNSGLSGTAVTAVPDTGYTFLNWSDGVTTASRTDTDVIRNIPVTANFAIDTYTLTYSAGGGGTISGATTQTVNYSSSGSAVTVVPPSGYSFTSWSDGSTQNPRTDTNVNQNITVTANFTANPASAPSGGGGRGGGAPTVTGTYDAAAARANNPDFNTDMNLPAAPPFTAWCVSGSLIKGSFPAVYYCGNDGKRYVFVNEKAYFSWYPDFSTVKTISDETLALIPLGGNVTYRPGSRMVKIQSDRKVYAVARGGTLRWIMTEAIAARLYGANWNKMIDDVSDAFFVNYVLGAPITQ
jgi:Listeria-Bacteroides repeat domain (List_Bact_rpt).